jgi:hypothetical protein
MLECAARLRSNEHGVGKEEKGKKTRGQKKQERHECAHFSEREERETKRTYAASNSQSRSRTGRGARCRQGCQMQVGVPDAVSCAVIGAAVRQQRPPLLLWQPQWGKPPFHWWPPWQG